MTENCSRATPRSALLSDMRMELQQEEVAKPIHGQKRSTSTYRHERESRCGVDRDGGCTKVCGFHDCAGNRRIMEGAEGRGVVLDFPGFASLGSVEP